MLPDLNLLLGGLGSRPSKLVPTIVPLRGPAGMTRHIFDNTSFGTANNEDDWYLRVPLADTFYYDGVGYNAVYVSTNAYITFGAGSVVYYGLQYNQPPVPTLHFGSADNSCQTLWYGTVGSGSKRATFIRYEGTAAIHRNTSSPNIIIEWYFYAGSLMTCVIGQHARLSGFWGWSNGSTGVSGMAPGPAFSMTSYGYESFDLGSNWSYRNGSADP